VGNVKKIIPSFKDNEIYISDSSDTELVRKFISDVFSGSALLLPLQAEEYVTFKIKKNNKEISWDETRPRLAGNWQNLLKGVHGVSIGISPKTGSIMEWNKEGKGYLFYVEKVSPEENLTVSGVGCIEEGMFSTLNLKKEEWIELRPVFISIT
jgi:surface antigen